MRRAGGGGSSRRGGRAQGILCGRSRALCLLLLTFFGSTFPSLFLFPLPRSLAFALLLLLLLAFRNGSGRSFSSQLRLAFLPGFALALLLLTPIRFSLLFSLLAFSLTLHLSLLLLCKPPPSLLLLPLLLLLLGFTKSLALDTVFLAFLALLLFELRLLSLGRCVLGRFLSSLLGALFFLGQFLQPDDTDT